MPVKNRFFDEFRETLPDELQGKVFCITGTTSGTGWIAAREIAARGGQLVLLNRPSPRVAAMMASLQQAVPNGTFVKVDCDLQSFAAVRAAAATVKRRYDKIFCLALNAGIMATPDQATIDGYDTQMQTNHLSQFLLTAELMPLLEAQAAAAEDNADAAPRVVTVTSLLRLQAPRGKVQDKYLGKNGGNLGGDSVNGLLCTGACYDRYFQTKLANTVFFSALHKKLQAKGSKVLSLCAHPGLSDTNLQEHLKGGWFTNFVLSNFGPWFMQSAEDGAAGLLMCATKSGVESGVLYGPNGMIGLIGKPEPNKLWKFETDETQMENVWRLSEEATGVKFLL